MTSIGSSTHTHPADRAGNWALGKHGESLAADFLRTQGFHLLVKNWRCRHGELDLIMRDGNSLVAVEVKTRSGWGYGSPLEAITAQKAARLRRLLLEWVRETGSHAPKLRIDAVGIVLSPDGGAPHIDHIRGIS